MDSMQSVSWERFVAQLRRRRKRLGLTQKGLAEVVGARQPIVSRIEKSTDVTRNLPMIARMAKAMGCMVEINLVPIDRLENGGKRNGDS